MFFYLNISAKAAGVKEVAVLSSAGDAFCRKNLNCSIEAVPIDDCRHANINDRV